MPGVSLFDNQGQDDFPQVGLGSKDILYSPVVRFHGVVDAELLLYTDNSTSTWFYSSREKRSFLLLNFWSFFGSSRQVLL
jgi:hypothetical protein